jgi:4'-phosphopantetheinyl transferase
VNVDVWRVDLARSPSSGALTSLDPVERARAARLRGEADRRRYVHRHAALRELLASYLGIAPARVAFDRRCPHCGDPEHGKPRLVDGAMHFSAAAAGDVALVAVSGEGEVGVDLVRVTDLPPPELDAMAQTALTQGERAAANGPEGFHRLFSRKEALGKLIGVGLLAEAQVLDTVITPAHLYDLSVPAGHVGALATERPLRRLTWRSLP